MILYVEEKDRIAQKKYLNQYFRLRKRVFSDQLKWKVPVIGDMEKDILDEAPCTYTLYIDQDDEVVGGARLIPTTQTTLLDHAFDGLIPSNISFKSPTIWESSRFCVDHDRSKAKLSAGAKKATLAISIGNYDYAVKNGIEFLIAVVEARLFEFSRNYNLDTQMLGEKIIDGGRVVCALYPITPEAGALADKMRPFVFDVACNSRAY
ncbi:MAG: acyl-homoserine-lactone synthase [Ahrensia sp.]|nr:acyl-homoserine-lactone synthase [Ahrensia sp.]